MVLGDQECRADGATRGRVPQMSALPYRSRIRGTPPPNHNLRSPPENGLRARSRATSFHWRLVRRSPPAEDRAAQAAPSAPSPIHSFTAAYQKKDEDEDRYQNDTDGLLAARGHRRDC